MKEFLYINETLAPLWILILLGFIINRGKLITKKTTHSMNKVVFSVFLPVLVFYNLYKADVEKISNWPVIFYAVIFTVVIFVLSLIIIPLLEKDNSKRSVLIQCIFRANVVLLGLPIATELGGSAAATLVTLIISIITPLYNILAVICFELFNGSELSFKRAFINILKNPLFIASILGLSVLMLNIRLPIIIEKSLSNIAIIATPLALILLGSHIEIRFSTFKHIFIGLFGRLIIAPGLCIAGSLLMGFRSVELIALMALGFTPTAVSSYIMACELNGDATLASDLFVYSTIGSALSIPGWIYLIQRFGFI